MAILKKCQKPALFSVCLFGCRPVPERIRKRRPQNLEPKAKHTNMSRSSDIAPSFFVISEGTDWNIAKKTQKRTLLRIKVKNVEKLFVGTSYVQTSSKTALLRDGVGKLQVKSAKAEVEAMRAEMKELKAPKWFPSKSLMSNSQPSAFLTLQERFLTHTQGPLVSSNG